MRAAVVVAIIAALSVGSQGVAVAQEASRSGSAEQLRVTAALEALDSTGALDLASATPLPPSPVQRHPGSEGDIFSVELNAGQRLSVSLTGDAETDFDVYLFFPTAVSVPDTEIAERSVTPEYPEEFEFDVAEGGVYYVWIHPYEDPGMGGYELTYTIAAAQADPQIVRMWGLTRYETACDVSAKTFSDEPSRDVVLASGQSFPDSLTGAGLAGVLGCPLLLTYQDRLPLCVPQELARLEATDIHIIGGPGAVSAGVQQALEDFGYTVFRHGGIDRYETAALVARAIGELTVAEQPRIALLARGDLFPDALVVSPIAYARRVPIVLTRPDTLPRFTQEALEALRVEEVIVAGGTGAISEPVVDSLRRLDQTPYVTRVGGIDRYETATLIGGLSVARFWCSPSYLGVASGTNFPDALSGGAAAGYWEGVLVLSRPTELPRETVEYVQEYADMNIVDQVAVYGGTGALSAHVEDSLEALLK